MDIMNREKSVSSVMKAEKHDLNQRNEIHEKYLCSIIGFDIIVLMANIMIKQGLNEEVEKYHEKANEGTKLTDINVLKDKFLI
mmetsp:Transcript_6703/g.5833  ORF Transcript_6703/g.5833 Transcript_6703/m.5833 type:complete len:83 (-) Transcript_6703:19-267(-)